MAALPSRVWHSPRFRLQVRSPSLRDLIALSYLERGRSLSLSWRWRQSFSREFSHKMQRFWRLASASGFWHRTLLGAQVHHTCARGLASHVCRLAGRAPLHAMPIGYGDSCIVIAALVITAVGVRFTCRFLIWQCALVRSRPCPAVRPASRPAEHTSGSAHCGCPAQGVA